MPNKIYDCKITVLKRMVNQDLAKEYLDEKYTNIGPCELLQDGQEFVVRDHSGVPEGMCPSAWADIRKDILAVATGADMPGINRRGTVIAGCTDWFRPVIFKVERIESD